MEEGKNIFGKQVIGISKTKEAGKPLTRLQMHAPASLEVDRTKADFGATPIPLLTPLGLSPNLFPGITDEFEFPIHDDKKATATSFPSAFAWKEPAGPGYAEASALFNLFQNKCVLVNDA